MSVKRLHSVNQKAAAGHPRWGEGGRTPCTLPLDPPLSAEMISGHTDLQGDRRGFLLIWSFTLHFMLAFKAGFRYRRSRSRTQKRRAYDLVKTAFRFRLRFHRLRSAYDLVKTRFSELEAETKPGNVHFDWLILPLLLPTPTIQFSLDHKQNVSDGVVSGVGRK